MWWRIIRRSFWNQRLRFALAIMSIVLGTGLVVALTNLSLEVPKKAGAQLRSYGANILILPETSAVAGEGYIMEKDLVFLDGEESARSVENYAPYLYGLAEINGQRVVAAGTRLDAVQRLSPWWQVTGRWPGNSSEALVGAQVAEKLGLGLDREITIGYGGNTRDLKIAGTVSTGAAEDSQVFVDLRVAQELLGQAGKVGLVQVSARAQKQDLTRVSQSIEQGIPGVEARVVGQIARAERQVLGKVQLLMSLVAGLIFMVAGLVILSIMTAILLERTREIGLMKALGASDRRIGGLLAMEVGIITIAGGLLGYPLGYLLAQFIGVRVFASTISPHPLAFLVGMAIAALVTFGGSALPLRRAMRIDPALTLRGE